LVTAVASASSATGTSITPLPACISAGPIASGSTRPRPPPSIIAGPPMPSDTFAVGRRALDQLGELTAAALGGDRQPAGSSSKRSDGTRGSLGLGA
jgi:hypothetical protein